MIAKNRAGYVSEQIGILDIFAKTAGARSAAVGPPRRAAHICVIWPLSWFSCPRVVRTTRAETGRGPDSLRRDSTGARRPGARRGRRGLTYDAATGPYENDSVNRICDRRILCILTVSVSFKNRLLLI